MPPRPRTRARPATAPEPLAPTAKRARALLRAAAEPDRVAVLAGFFKTGPGEYGHGDRFLGVRVPAVRKIVRELRGMSAAENRALLESPWHEERLLALLVMVDRYARADAGEREAIYHEYLDSVRWINNWDLVDSSAPHIVGGWLLETRDTRVLDRLAKSKDLWERRIAMLATFTFIRAGNFAPAISIATVLLGDSHDLIHKAAGWMLREVGERDVEVLRGFLREHAATMPRTMLRYAIEKMGVAERERWMAPGGPVERRKQQRRADS